MTTYLPVNNYYGINECNIIYIGFWKNKNIGFLELSLLSLFSLLYLSICYHHEISNNYKVRKLKPKELGPHTILQNHKTRNVHFILPFNYLSKVSYNCVLIYLL